MVVSLEWNWYFNIAQMYCCCTYILMGTRFFKFASARFSFREAAHYVHPVVTNQFSFWWLSPSLALFVLCIIALMDDDIELKKKMAIPVAVSYGLWALNNENFLWQSQTHYAFERDNEHQDPYPKAIMPGPKGLKMEGFGVRLWGLAGACGTTTLRNILYACDPVQFRLVILVVGIVEAVILSGCLTSMMVFLWQSRILHEIAFCADPVSGFDLTKDHLLRVEEASTEKDPEAGLPPSEAD